MPDSLKDDGGLALFCSVFLQCWHWNGRCVCQAGAQPPGCIPYALNACCQELVGPEWVLVNSFLEEGGRQGIRMCAGILPFLEYTGILIVIFSVILPEWIISLSVYIYLSISVFYFEVGSPSASTMWTQVVSLGSKLLNSLGYLTSLGLLGSYSVAQADLVYSWPISVTVLLPRFSECWDYRQGLPLLVYNVLFKLYLFIYFN